ncbi:hypothetical protein PanWU01x14_010290, partial [Parasponia andersonii]
FLLKPKARQIWRTTTTRELRDFKFAPVAPIHVTTTAMVTVNTNPKTSSGYSFSDGNWGDFVTIHSDQINDGFQVLNGTAIQSSSNQNPLDLSGNLVDDNEYMLNQFELMPS